MAKITSNQVVGMARGLSAFISGKPTASQVVGGGVSPYDLTLVQANCSAIATVSATSSTTFTIIRSGTTIGTIVFAAGATAGSVSLTQSNVTAGALVTIVAPATADATLANVTFLLRS